MAYYFHYFFFFFFILSAFLHIDCQYADGPRAWDPRSSPLSKGVTPWVNRSLTAGVKGWSPSGLSQKLCNPSIK